MTSKLGRFEKWEALPNKKKTVKFQKILMAEINLRRQNNQKNVLLSQIFINFQKFSQMLSQKIVKQV